MKKPLTIEELKALPVGDWVWVKDVLEEKYWQVYSNEGSHLLVLASDCITDNFNYSDYGKTWLAYKNKEQAEAEAKGEIVELPCLRELPILHYHGIPIRRKELVYLNEHEQVTVIPYAEDEFPEAEKHLAELKGEN